MTSMMRFLKSNTRGIGSLFLVAGCMGLAQTGHANPGLHLGWCTPHNPHYNSVACGGLGGASTTVPGGTTNSIGNVSGASGSQPVVNTQPIVVAPLPPAASISGHGVITSSPGPDITGFSPGYVITPLAPQSFAGVSPGAIQSIPGPSYSGYSPAINVNAIVVPSFAGVSPVPVVHPVLAPSFSGTSPVVTILPVSAPSFTGLSPVVTLHPVPTPSFGGSGTISQQQTIPSVNVSIAPVVVPRPRPKPKMRGPAKSVASVSATHSPDSVGSQNHNIITPVAGRQDARNAPSVITPEGERISCLTSGHGARQNIAASGRNPSVLRNANRIDSLARDIPARHADVAHCLISIRTSPTR